MFNENYETNFNLTPLQKEFKEEHGRQGAAGVRAGKTPRNLVSLALVPHGESLTKDSHFVLHNKVQILSFGDQVREFPEGGWCMQALGKKQNHGLNGSGTVSVGESCDRVVDFHKFPRQPLPLTLVEHTAHSVAWPTGGGDALIRKTDNGYSFYMGRLKVNRRNRKKAPPQLVFHILAEYFEGENAVASLAGGVALPTEGKDTVLGPVRGGTPCVALTGEIRFEKTARRRGKYRSTLAPGLVLSTHDRSTFSVLNKMNKAHNDFVLSPEKIEEVYEPSQWLFKPMVEFNEERLCKTILDKGFKPSSELVAEVLFQMSLEGTYDIRRISRAQAEQSVSASGEVIINYADGKKQVLPSCAILDPSLTSLGQYCPRKRYDWAEFSEMMGDLLLPFMRDFIIAQAVQPGHTAGWNGPGILIDAVFARSLIRYANKDSQGKTKWYWDCRQCLQYLHADTGAIVGPPIMCDSQDPQLNLGVMTVNLAFPSLSGGDDKRTKKSKPYVKA